MVIRCVLATAITMMLSVVGCDYGLKAKNAANLERQGEFVWLVPEGFPIPTVPADNPMTWDKVELGRQLFYDSRLSGDGSVSCASCHQPGLAFTDGRGRAVGIQGNIHPRSAMSLTNVAYNATLGWDDPTLTRLEDIGCRCHEVVLIDFAQGRFLSYVGSHVIAFFSLKLEKSFIPDFA